MALRLNSRNGNPSRRGFLFARKRKYDGRRPPFLSQSDLSVDHTTVNGVSRHCVTKKPCVCRPVMRSTISDLCLNPHRSCHMSCAWRSGSIGGTGPRGWDGDRRRVRGPGRVAYLAFSGAVSCSMNVWSMRKTKEHGVAVGVDGDGLGLGDGVNILMEHTLKRALPVPHTS